MLQEPADELHGIQGHAAIPRTALFSVFKGHFTVFDQDDAIIAYGCLENIAGQIFYCVFSISHGLNVDVPVDTPDLGWNLIKKAFADHDVPELGLVHL